MAILKGAVADCPAASVARTVKLEFPTPDGVPLIVPSAARLNPAGNEPLATTQVYGGVPPLALRAAEYAVPTLPPGSGVDAITTGVVGVATTILSCAVAD
jgi:hypothetical protein